MPASLRALAPLVLLATVALTLTGCEKTSYTCKNGSCAVTLSGAGASTDLGNGSGSGVSGPELTLVGAGDGTAELSYDGESGTCGDNQTITLGGLTMTCTLIGDDEVKLVNVS